MALVQIKIHVYAFMHNYTPKSTFSYRITLKYLIKNDHELKLLRNKE